MLPVLGFVLLIFSELPSPVLSYKELSSDYKLEYVSAVSFYERYKNSVEVRSIEIKNVYI